jgi:HAD superfamily hydrolase (TIGR01509 family)
MPSLLRVLRVSAVTKDIRMIRAVLFDLGGTLLEFNPHHLPWLEWERAGLQSAHASFTAQGYELPLEAFVARFEARLPERWEQAARGGANLRLADVLREACRACGVSPAAGEVEAAMAAYIAPLDAHVVAYDDALDTLEALRARGLKIGLISNTMWPGEFHLREMERTGILPYFDHTLFSADAGLWKPQPAIYHLCLDALDVSAQEAVFVGDMPAYDILGAQRAGIRSVYKRNVGSPLDGVEPDAEIDALAELPGLIGELGD